MCAPDADLAHAVENLVDGAIFNSGQCCCGIERIYVHQARLRRVRRRLRRPDRDSTCWTIPLRPGDDARSDGPYRRRRVRARARSRTR